MRTRLITVSAAVALLSAFVVTAPAHASVPEAPTIMSLTPASGQLTVGYLDAAGATGHRYSVNGGSTTAAASSPFVITGLPNGQVACISMTAQNADGSSSPSNTWCGVPNNPSTVGSVAPVITGVTATSNALVISYTRADDGFAIDRYQVWLNGTLYSDVTDFRSPMTIAGLTADSAYAIQIKAQGPAGAPDSTKSASYSARTEPGAAPAPTISAPEPPGVTVTSVGRTSVSFAIVPPTNTGGQNPTAYRFTIDGRTTEVSPTELTHTVTGLRTGVTYAITANAANSAGWSAPGTATATTVIVPPSAPRNVRVTPGARDAVVTWDPPLDDGGAPVAYYTTLESGIAACFDIAGTRGCRLPSLAPNTWYDLQVFAVNAGGVGESARAPFTTLVGEPFPVRDLTATALSSASVRVSWLAPLDTGGAPVTYAVNATNRRTGITKSVCQIRATSCTVNDLTSKVPYDLTVIADNGQSRSRATTTVTLTTQPPTAPRDVVATQVGDRFVVTWEPPANADRAAVGGYRVRLFSDDKTDTIGHLDERVVCNVGPRTRTCTTASLRPWLHYNVEVDVFDEDMAFAAKEENEYQPLKSMPVAPITLAEAGNGSASVTVVDQAANVFREGDTFRVIRVDDWFGLVTVPACTIVRPATTCTVTGLENGRGYRFLAYSVNSAGESPAGLPSQVVEPVTNPKTITAPSAPRNVRASSKVAVASAPSPGWPGVKVGASFAQIPTGADEDVWMSTQLSWNAPENTGGARDILYRVTLVRLPSLKGDWREYTGSTTYSCATRELRCELRWPFRTGYPLKDTNYAIFITALTAGGRSLSLWGFNSDGSLTEVRST